MRIRTIKPEFFLHEGLYDAEVESGLPLRLAFAGLWCAADREGLFRWEPRKLKAQIMPYDSVDFSRVLDALSTRGFIVKYASGTGEFGVIPSFSRHQVINNRERASDLPNPPEHIPAKQVDASTTRASRVPDETPELKSGREGNKEQGTSEAMCGVGDGWKSTRPRNELLDALVSVDGSDPLKTTRPAFAKAAKALQDIKAVTPEVTPNEIARRAENYRKHMPNVTISSMALATHWAKCDQPPMQATLQLHSPAQIDLNPKSWI